MCFLDTHNKKYDFSLEDGLSSLVTWISGAPYAERHWELSKKVGASSVWGHRTVAVIEYLPIVGAIAALIERIVFFVIETFFRKPPQKSPPLLEPGRVAPLEDEEKKAESEAPPRHPETTVAKMLRNATKAVAEHRESFFERCSIYASVRQAIPMEEILFSKKLPPLKIKCSSSDAQGPKNSMEDRHLYQEIEGGVLTAVFDGHGGKDVAIQAQTEFRLRFSDVLRENNGNVHQTFTQLINEIHIHVKAKKLKGGTTVVVCFIDISSHFIYTATLADSEANIYRKIDGRLKSIPLSCIRNWSTPKDARRAAKYLAGRYKKKGKELASDFRRDHLNAIKVNRQHENQIVELIKSKAISHKQETKHSHLTPTDVYSLCNRGMLDYMRDSSFFNLLKEWNGYKESVTMAEIAIKTYQALAEVYLTEDAIYAYYHKHENQKRLRIEHLNVSRGIGDLRVKEISQKPKITMNQLIPGDLLILACDGLKDFVPERAIALHLEQLNENEDPAQSLVNLALATHQAKDNVTVVALKVAYEAVLKPGSTPSKRVF